MHVLEAERQRKSKEVRRKFNHSSQSGQAQDNCKLSEDRNRVCLPNYNGLSS